MKFINSWKKQLNFLLSFFKQTSLPFPYSHHGASLLCWEFHIFATYQTSEVAASMRAELVVHKTPLTFIKLQKQHGRRELHFFLGHRKASVWTLSSRSVFQGKLHVADSLLSVLPPAVLVCTFSTSFSEYITHSDMRAAAAAATPKSSQSATQLKTHRTLRFQESCMFTTCHTVST